MLDFVLKQNLLVLVLEQSLLEHVLEQILLSCRICIAGNQGPSVSDVEDFGGVSHSDTTAAPTTVEFLGPRQ